HRSRRSPRAFYYRDSWHGDRVGQAGAGGSEIFQETAHGYDVGLTGRTLVEYCIGCRNCLRLQTVRRLSLANFFLSPCYYGTVYDHDQCGACGLQSHTHPSSGREPYPGGAAPLEGCIRLFQAAALRFHDSPRAYIHTGGECGDLSDHQCHSLYTHEIEKELYG